MEFVTETRSNRCKLTYFDSEVWLDNVRFADMEDGGNIHLQKSTKEKLEKFNKMRGKVDNTY